MSLSHTNTPIILCSQFADIEPAIVAKLNAQFIRNEVCDLRKLESLTEHFPCAPVVVLWNSPTAELRLIAQFCRERQIPLVVLLKETISMDINKINETNDLVVLPFNALDCLVPWIEYAKQVRHQAIQLQQQIEQLSSKLEERRWVEKAKGLLMKFHAMDESQAYKALRNTSMKSSQPMVDIARNVITTLERTN